MVEKDVEISYISFMTKMTAEIYSEFIKSGTIISKNKKSLLIGWGERQWSQSPLNGEGPDFYFPDFFLKIGMPWFCHDSWLEISSEELLEFNPENKTTPVKWETAQLPFFESKFLELQELIEQKELVKAVPYLFQTSNAKMTDQLLQSTLNSLCKYIGNFPAEIYGLWHGTEGFLGATPEILFNKLKHSNELETVACAGTFNSDIEDAEVCPKLLLEHGIVVEGIKKSLDIFGSVRQKALQQIKFACLTHLITPILVSLDEELDFTKIVRSLHPTPALGAYPRDKGMLWLEEYQMGMPRGRYGAPAGFQLNSHAKCLVGIRNVQWGTKGLLIGAGCGVVSGSTLKLELQEIHLKLQAIKELLGL